MKSFLALLLTFMAAEADGAGFSKAVKALEEYGYFVGDSKDCSGKFDSSNKSCSESKGQNCLISKLQEIDRLEQRTKLTGRPFENIDTSRIVEISSYFVKSKGKVAPSDLHGRAHIEEWICKSAEDAKNIHENLSLYLWAKLCVPASAWIKGKTVYVLRVGGFYMQDEMKKLESKLKEETL